MRSLLSVPLRLLPPQLLSSNFVTVINMTAFVNATCFYVDMRANNWREIQFTGRPYSPHTGATSIVLLRLNCSSRVKMLRTVDSSDATLHCAGQL